MAQTAGSPVTFAGEEDYLRHLRALWQQRWPAEVPREPRYPLGEIPLTEYLRAWAARTPDKPVVVFYGRELSYGELDRLSDRFAAMLRNRGLEPGDRVAVFLPNCPQFYIVFFGILKAGCVHVPVSPMFTAPELAYELKDSQASFLVTHDQLLATVNKLAENERPEHILVTASQDFLPEEPVAPLPASLTQPRVPYPEAQDLMRVIEAEGDGAPLPPADLDVLAALNYTGGTTGFPKGCMHTQRNMLYTAAVITSISADITADDVLINFWPLFWVAGEDVGILATVMTGSTCVLLARWDPDAFFVALERHKVSCVFMLVDNAVELMAHPRARQGSLRALKTVLVVSFVKKLNVTFRRQWEEIAGTVLREAAWGMTETHSFDATTRGLQDGDFDLNGRQIFIGLPVPGTEFKILEFGSDRLVRLGEEGELCVKTPSRLLAYLNKPEETANSIVDGWLRTGDIGMISEEGFIYFLGRRKEMLKLKGMSIFPAEIEAVLGQHPAVLGSGVIGREDPERGEVPVAFIVVSPDKAHEVTPDDIAAFCRERLSAYKVPEVRIIGQLPMTPTGKVKKHELKDLL
ncbi:AMP-binding protein [Rhodoligotrophos defluvii]|uniref:AMP-binding protein n=1 Tax=Rhodoligotrophos defluvii TaxID=2561934 RepID=UPI0010C987EF|nr:AMP-binding protein [Rhodoligotrophos defluvii]